MSNVTLTISGLLEDLDNGLKREQIAEKYGLTVTAVRDIFKHPKLKGKQARQPRNYVLIDDTEDTQEDTVSGSNNPVSVSPEPDRSEDPEPIEEVIAQPQPEVELEKEQEVPQATTQSLI